ncbi:MAG: LacI family DNA-binding transcriptional regulator [Ruminiclostridium sp.]
MKKYSILDVATKCGLDTDSIVQVIKSYHIPTPTEGDSYVPDASSYVLLCKIAKVIKQNNPPEIQKQKITSLIQNVNANITISDVAIAAGVSIGAVSTVLNNREGNIKISDRTKKRIMSTVDELGYRANPFASALRTKQTGIIGAVIRDIDDPFLRQLIKEVQKICNYNGLDILMSNAKHEVETAEKQINLILHQWFDGLIILGDMVVDNDLMYSLSKNNLPVVSLNGGQNNYLSTVRFDDVYGTHIVFDYLYNLGHKDIAFIGNTKHESVQVRLSTFMHLKKEHGLNCSDGFTFTASTSYEAMNITKTILNMPNPPSAIFCSSDLLALGSMIAIFQSGKKIPEDISIIGYDDIDELHATYIPITTVRQPVTEAANCAVTELTKQISAISKGLEIIPSNIVIQPELIIRESCATPRRHSTK